METEDHGVNLHALLQLALLCLGLVGCGRALPPENTLPADTRPTVEVVAVTSAAEAGAVRASGLVGYKRETELSFDAPGVIASLLVDEGDHVVAGQRLATLRRTTVGSNATEAALARETAERLLARTQALFERGFVSQTALDEALLAVERAKESTVLVSPASGVILRRRAEPAQMVTAGFAVLVLGETTSGIVVRAAVLSQASSRIRLGDPVEVRVTGHTPRNGEVARVAPKSDDATGAFEVEVKLADSKGIRSGQVAEVTIAAATADANESITLIVPALSLLDARADQGVVFVIDDDDIARRRSIQTAGLSQDGVLVVSGLLPGERIVAAGTAYVRDGEPVRIIQPS